jgi:hypothetical protein
LHTISQELDRVLSHLDSETARLLEQTVRDALALAGRHSRKSEQTDALGYPLRYFEDTAGSFAAEELERPRDLPLENRDAW